MDVDEFFREHAASRAIFESVWEAASSLGPVELRATKSQIALVRSKPFAWVWVPEMHLRRKAAPLVLSFSFKASRPWSRWKEIYQAAPHRFTHHLELWSPEEVDVDVRAWLREAWEDRGERPR